MLKLFFTTSISFLLRCTETHTSTLERMYRPASLMQVKTMKSVAKLPGERLSSRRRMKHPKTALQSSQNSTRHDGRTNTLSLPDVTMLVLELNSTRPAVIPLHPAFTEVDSLSEAHYFRRGVLFIVVSSAFALAALQLLKLEKTHKDLLGVGVMVIVLWFTMGLTAFMGHVLPIANHEDGLTMIQTAYLCVQILTTVGYGDLTPASPYGRLFVSIYALSALVMVAGLISQFADYLVKKASRDLAQGLENVRKRLDKTHGSLAIQGVDDMEKLKPYKRLRISVLYFSASVLAGTLFYGSVAGEAKTMEEALYMSIVTLSTVGFGDQVAKTEGGKAFGCIWMVMGVSSMARMVSEFTEVFIQMRQGWTTEHLTDNLLKQMDTDGNGKVDKVEYLHFTLRRYGLVSKEDLDALMAQFDSLDRDKSGFLDAEDLRLFE